MMMPRVLVCGSADAARGDVERALEQMRERREFTLLYGGERGAEHHAWMWAARVGVYVEGYAVKADKPDRAGYVLDLMRPDLVLAFGSTPWTDALLARCKDKNIKTYTESSREMKVMIVGGQDKPDTVATLLSSVCEKFGWGSTVVICPEGHNAFDWASRQRVVSRRFSNQPPKRVLEECTPHLLINFAGAIGPNTLELARAMGIKVYEVPA